MRRLGYICAALASRGLRGQLLFVGGSQSGGFTQPLPLRHVPKEKSETSENSGSLVLPDLFEAERTIA